MATEYRRLSRPHFGLNGTASIWLGGDHIMQVSTMFGWEKYRRWFYRDIQALIARRNATRLIWYLIVGLGGVFIAAGALLSMSAGASSSSSDRAGLFVIAGILGTVAVSFLAVALINTLLGPTCSVYVQTPHGMEKLSGPGRLAVFERLVEQTRSLIDSAQTAETGGSELRQIAAAFDQPPPA
jgi:hypothetical protein